MKQTDDVSFEVGGRGDVDNDIETTDSEFDPISGLKIPACHCVGVQVQHHPTPRIAHFKTVEYKILKLAID